MKLFKKIIIFIMIMFLISCGFVFSVASNTEIYTLQKSKVLRADGTWGTSLGAYNDRWEYYNCYAFALHREENSHFYSGEIENSMYQPGYMSGDTPPGETPSYVNVSRLAKLVKNDLIAMGYSDVTLSGSLPTIDSTQELICVRTGHNTNPDSNDSEIKYHFMRFDLETGAWYHKPGNCAIMKYDYVPNNNELELWTNEHSLYGTEHEGSVVYDSSIVFISYTKKQINVSTSALSEQNINPGKDVFCEVNFEYAGGCNLQLNSQYSFEYELYNDNFDVVASGSGASINTTFSVSAGRYYLRMNFENALSSTNSINVSFTHTHSYTDHYALHNYSQHKAYCGCGEYSLGNHVVAQGALPDSNGYGICILCRGQVFMGNLNSIPGSNMPHTANGSYILQNGVIVLVDEDIEAYMIGTLVFYTGEVQ